MQKGKIGVTTENIFPIIKKFLYSDHEIFLRELISNAVDATQKMKKLASMGDFQGDLGDLTVNVELDKKKKTLTIKDRGLGMTAEEIDKYINQIAFSSADEFLKKFKDQATIIGKFGLGFYSAFMVAKKVDIITRSYKEDAQAVKWSCDGSPEFTLEEIDKADRGTDIVLHIEDEDSKEFLEENRIDELLKKYCSFLPVPVAFGTEKEWKDGKEVDTGKPKVINNTEPLWTKMPADLKDEDYNEFYQKLYPFAEEPLFHIHLNVDYPFNLTGILYFPKIKNNIEIQKNKIQLYANQVFVTDSVEGIVPEFLTLLHGVIDSPDIPLNVSRSYLQSDSNVKKISNHITKKVAGRLEEIFKQDRTEFEKKWDDLKVFIEYGMLTDEKFYEKAEKFALFKNTDGKYFTFDEYQNLIKDEQTDRNKTLIYLYATDADKQYTFIENAKAKGYDVLLMDGDLDSHFINQLEQKFKDSRFVRVDSDVVDKLIQKKDVEETNLSAEERNELTHVFEAELPASASYTVVFENLDENSDPMVITQSEFMRRMKDMAAMGGGGMNFYGEMPDSYSLVVNPNHRLVKRIIEDKQQKVDGELKPINEEVAPLKQEKEKLEKEQEKKKEEEVSQADKDKIEELDKQIQEKEARKKEILQKYAKENNLVKQLIDIALSANNMLTGADLTRFVKRSIDMI
jgi:molecular chaperone HtpG